MATNKSLVCLSPLERGLCSPIFVQIKGWSSQQEPTEEQRGKKRIKHKALLSLCSPFSSILSSSLRVCGLVLRLWFACVLCSDGQLFLKSLQGLEERGCCTDRLVGVGGQLRAVRCGYLLRPDENMFLPVGCCSFSGQGQRPRAGRDYGHIVSSPCPWGKERIVVLFVGHFSGM